MTGDTIDFDHLDPAIAATVHDHLAAMRDQRGLARSPHHGGFHVVTRHTDIAEVCRDHHRFSAHADAIGASTLLSGVENATAPLFEQDPPEHSTLRGALHPHFSRTAAARYAPAIRDTVRAELALLAPRGRGDLVTDLAQRIPPLVIADILGFTPQRRHTLRDLMLGAVCHGDAAPYFAFLTDEVRHRRRHPGDDPLGIVAADPAVEEADAVKYLLMFLAAGALTTIDTIANLLWLLPHHPEIADLPRHQVIDEVVRLEAPVATTARTVRRPARLADTDLSPGDRLLIAWGAGSRDHTRYDHPDRFDPHRDQHSGIAWGAGAHRCIGQHIARVEVAIVLDEVLTALPHLVYPAGWQPERTYGVLRGIRALPATWTSTSPHHR